MIPLFVRDESPAPAVLTIYKPSKIDDEPDEILFQQLVSIHPNDVKNGWYTADIDTAALVLAQPSKFFVSFRVPRDKRVAPGLGFRFSHRNKDDGSFYRHNFTTEWRRLAKLWGDEPVQSMYRIRWMRRY